MPPDNRSPKSPPALLALGRALAHVIFEEQEQEEAEAAAKPAEPAPASAPKAE